MKEAALAAARPNPLPCRSDMASIRCPACGVTIAWVPANHVNMAQDAGGTWFVEWMSCPNCAIALTRLGVQPQGAGQGWRATWPRSAARLPCPPGMPDAICADYQEACLVLEDSAKASAALSRRCLQHILRDAGKVKPGNLADEIDEVINGGRLPPDIAESLDAVRHIGNFAAHPIKSQNTGAVIDVEAGEAEWNLEVVEALMDVYYVQKARLAAKKAALNAKLQEAGKAPIP